MHNFDRTFLLSNTLFCCLFLLLRLFSLERALFPIFFTQLLFFYYAGKKKHCRSTKPNNTSPYSQCHNLAQDRPVAPSPPPTSRPDHRRSTLFPTSWSESSPQPSYTPCTLHRNPASSPPLQAQLRELIQHSPSPHPPIHCSS